VRHSLTTRRPEPSGRRAVAALDANARARTILIAGVVHSVDRLNELAQIERTRLRSVVSHAARGTVDVVVMGAASPSSVALEVIGELKRDSRAAVVPVLHLVPDAAACGTCGAEVCLPARASAATLVGVTRTLLRTRRAETPDASADRLLALGRLTGSVVHDFNNLLLVIAGHVELARRLMGDGHPAAVRLFTVMHAVERASALNRQLLSFGRSTKPADVLADLDALVLQLEPTLRRMLGAYVQLEVRTGGGRGLVTADPTQLEQLLLNLVLNARDAMPGGGRLTVETQEAVVAAQPTEATQPVPPGRYVVLAVSDEGMGIDADARSHIFEPFYTTKAPGAGSGLGLASVHRIAQQAGGHVTLDSEPGFGTTFRVHLPWAGARPAIVAAGSSAPPPAGRETVLVADGSDPVRDVTRELLEGLGYTVLVASNAEEALRLARERREPIDVVLADAAMPGLHGGRLDQQLVEARPHTRVLLMAADAASGVAKPFTQDRLARAVRDALDAHRG
jgi:signal transduction histidine kinase/CheY-like chemotaxis protein